MTDSIQGTSVPTADVKKLRATGVHGPAEFLFYEFPNGNPPGQIKAFVREKLAPHERRIPFDNLPTTALQETFVSCTGKKSEELGVTVMK